jgi:phosphoglycolate phosphatase
MTPIDVRAVFFDLDGTLLDTIPDLAAAVNATLADFARPALPEESVRSYVGRGVAHLIRRALADSLDAGEDTPVPSDALASFRKHYARENGKRTQPFLGMQEGLQAIRRLGLPMAVITNKAAMFTGPLLEMTGLAEFFSLVVSGGDLPKHKPDPMSLTGPAGASAFPPPRYCSSVIRSTISWPRGRPVAASSCCLTDITKEGTCVNWIVMP